MIVVLTIRIKDPYSSVEVRHSKTDEQVYKKGNFPHDM